MHSQTVGREVAHARRENQLTQRELAARLGVDQSYIAAIETGRANPTVGQLAHLAGALGARLQISLTVPERATIHIPDHTA